MKWLIIVLASIGFLAMLVFTPHAFDPKHEDKMIKKYVESRGKTKPPKTFRRQMGDGI